MKVRQRPACPGQQSRADISPARDVIHSFFLPNLRLRQDAVPGRSILVWFEATKAGKYELPCAELCGFGHSGMKGWLYVHTPEEYTKWAEDNLSDKSQ